jgi:hypothetical protein
MPETVLHPWYPAKQEVIHLWALDTSLREAGLPQEDRLAWVRYAHAGSPRAREWGTYARPLAR